MRFTHLRAALVVSLSLIAGAVVMVSSSACSNQGEGEVCNMFANNSGNDDCQNGLICTSVHGVLGDRCCPADLALATTAVCAGTQFSVDANPSVPDGNGADSATDGAAESATDSATADESDGAATTDGATTDGATTDGDAAGD